MLFELTAHRELTVPHRRRDFFPIDSQHRRPSERYLAAFIHSLASCAVALYPAQALRFLKRLLPLARRGWQCQADQWGNMAPTSGSTFHCGPMPTKGCSKVSHISHIESI